MAVILLTDHHPGLIAQVQQYLLDRYNITGVDVSTRYIRDLPRSEDQYSTAHLNQMCITDYYPLKSSCEYIDDITDIQAIGDVIASEYIKPQVYFTDSATTTKEWLGKIQDFTCWDIETTGLRRPATEQITMSALSISPIKSIVFIHTPEIEQLIMDFLTTTDKTIGVHNILYEQRYVYDRTGKFIQNWEDSQLLAAAYLNTSPKPSVGLKHLAKYPYKDWANAKESFDLMVDSTNYVNDLLYYVGDNPDYKQYNLPLVYYNGIDVMATHFLLDKYLALEPKPELIPIEKLLPIPPPKDYSESVRYFYENVMKPVIKPIVKMLSNGMPIDVSKLPALRTKVETIREDAYKAFLANPKIAPYVAAKVAADTAEFLANPTLANFVPVQPSDCPVKEYKNVVVINQFIFKHLGCCPSDSKPLSLKEMKEFDQTNMPAVMVAILNKQDLTPFTDELTELIKQYQIFWADKQNSIHNRLDKVTNPTKYIYPDGIIINPQSSKQIRELFNSLGIHSNVLTEAKEESFAKPVLEELSKTVEDTDIRDAIRELIHIADGRNLISQYLPKYENSNYGNRISHNLKFPGTLSFRLSGGSDSKSTHDTGINGVTQPASTSKYYKEVKELFRSTDPEWLIYQIDYEGLELNVNANLTHDKTKLQILNDGFDMHTKHACSFYKKEIEEHIGKPIEDSLEFNLWLKDQSFFKPYRNSGKPVTFKMEYGGFPDIHKGGTISQEIFDAFHNELYPGVTKFKKEYVEPTSQANNKLHLGFGAHIFSDDPQKHALTLFNVNFQFFSILVPIASAKFDNLLESTGMSEHIKPFNMIHDANYGLVRNEPKHIKWLNDNLVKTMCEDYLVDQLVPLKAAVDIGYDLYNVQQLPNNADLQTIIDKLSTL